MLDGISVSVCIYVYMYVYSVSVCIYQPGRRGTHILLFNCCWFFFIIKENFLMHYFAPKKKTKSSACKKKCCSCFFELLCPSILLCPNSLCKKVLYYILSRLFNYHVFTINVNCLSEDSFYIHYITSCLVSPTFSLLFPPSLMDSLSLFVYS